MSSPHQATTMRFASCAAAWRTAQALMSSVDEERWETQILALEPYPLYTNPNPTFNLV